MATSKKPGGFSDEQLEAIKKRREELLERIRTVDPATLYGLMLSTGAPSSSGIEVEDWHKYWFKVGGGFSEGWSKAAELKEDESE